ncbi:ACR139Cp [Eremothecium gossypii ATCC 10895]|uniref:Serine/threonine-protein phosphatase 2A activator 2 n=1 Tax=Eremothecium gossypii (strain ATCC 10895 / CBS 109.51 / FGSC 9923 / NRRL Y-1056) TaxID=284811 RepID=PTPA2_EREGS|nr:ACR139Cp [Eremothecium gossypii ATCC 10895]Q75BY1.1 RecName: Full=Serine/threonine-protein phosphatase 2A activator 2; AltName: Full=Peptidyl-prolyl cis-trans isomerase PTPA-2; Short=PPIase PTPA-2; Short=Rotamase PTPA-2; AltName: Full=Phosphotyrosyl phosphatase activator 2 [Eremothecium gossypii ATCC 10895]AAS51365.1 ACR139Cp [Eremothecium gossypii ATCC 10895]AEY95656.1 FACR139Cp [Eremothecium gossypii FDAG1]
MSDGAELKMAAQKRLLTGSDLDKWKASKTFEELLRFVSSLAQSVRGRENSEHAEPVSPAIEALEALLEEMQGIAAHHPVLQDAATSRFGKVEFRDFHKEVQARAEALVLQVDPSLTDEQAQELAVYLGNAWGDCKRIDYGSGHELNFVCFLYGLWKYGVLSEHDFTNAVLRVFVKYMDVMRVLETKYWLEPAGSHGVWGLDDYHFLPFLFGAFQLATHKHLKPKSIHNPEVVELFENRYLYFGCIAFINRVKTTASLRWHSPMLDDISGVRSWTKVSEGMVKMYKAEVLGKLPIMQHFFFSRFLPVPDGVSPPRTSEEELADCSEHAHSTWGDCCGIPIPSAVAASEATRKHSKPLPFD